MTQHNFTSLNDYKKKTQQKTTNFEIMKIL